MKKNILIFLGFFLSLAGFVAAEERGGGFASSGFSGGRSESSVSPRLRSIGVRSVPRRFSQRSQLFSSRNVRNLSLPSQGPRGESFHASVIAPRFMSSSLVRNNMISINNAGFRASINTYNARENIVGRYYWHNYNGNNFCHYYDRWGCNWYGWNCGAGFYWSCWWGNNWWWYDPIAFRWCYWYDGWWWWQNPDNVTEVDVYNNGDYVPSDSEQPQNLEGTQVPAVKASSLSNDFNSKDRTRMVKLVGSSRDAFLYDTTETPAFKAKYLASGVKEVHFSNATAEKPLQIMLILKDDSFELYDANGDPVGNN